MPIAGGRRTVWLHIRMHESEFTHASFVPPVWRPGGREHYGNEKEAETAQGI